MAGALASGSALAADRFLPAEEAFRLEVRRTAPDHAELRFAIAPGYYLYRAPLAVQAEGAQAGPLALPPGVVRYDENFQKEVETYHDTLQVGVPLHAVAGPVTLVVQSQGCAEAGLCYPLATTRVHLTDAVAEPGPGSVSSVSALGWAVLAAGAALLAALGLIRLRRRRAAGRGHGPGER